MAPIQRLAAGPLTIITGALFSALSGPDSTPPSNGTNATVWGTVYKGSASFLNLTLETIPSPITPTLSPISPSPIPSPTVSSRIASPTTPTSPIPFNSSLVYYNTTTDTYSGCNNKTFLPTDNVALMNPLQFGDIKSDNSTCGEWIQIVNRENTELSTFAQIVGVCEECPYGSVSLNQETLQELAPELPFDQMIFDPASNLTIANITDAAEPLDPASNPISPMGLLNIAWELAEAPVAKPTPTLAPIPTRTRTSTTITTTTTTTTTTKAKKTTTTTTTTKTKTKTKTKKPEPTEKPSGKVFTGRATWFSDTFGQCEHSYSQSDMIVAINEAQMGTGKKLCGKKILATMKGSDVEVVLTVVDMCPGRYCSHGAIDISRGAFKKFADLDKGVLQLQWRFLD
ncbi:hypothetical protein BGZ50_002129 [Haplosporangium sp. Z 11]|nr:hypothetical protein BGZ50_002129 [Haplosporangium sp. Z 11]